MRIHYVQNSDVKTPDVVMGLLSLSLSLSLSVSILTCHRDVDDLVFQIFYM